MTTQRNRNRDLAGAPPKLATLDDLDIPTSPKRSSYAQMRKSKKPFGINLKQVAEACMDEGLDPAVEIAKALKAMVPLFRSGKQVFDENGKPVMVPALDTDTRMRTLNEFLQYTQPKLKSVEVKMSGSLELTSEQLDERLNMLLMKAAK